jgi:hypothetical protein
MKLTDLKPAPYNPRTITDEAAAALQTSLAEFGDISGIVWNKRTGHLVAGHQRMEALRRKHGKKLSVRDGAVCTSDGERFPIRVVNWPLEKEKTANLAANSPYLAGSFDSGGLEALLADLNAADGLSGLLEGLRLNELLPGAGDLFPVTGGDGDNIETEGEAGSSEVSGEFVTFSVPLTPSLHKTVMDAVRAAKSAGCDKVSDCLFAICTAYLEEQSNE